jgi:hypothetical protein
MRFPQVAIGQRFIYRGKHYTKTGPLTASEEGGGGDRQLIPKAAHVTLIDGQGEPLQATKQRYSRAEMQQVMERFKSDLIGALREMEAALGGLPLERVIELIREQRIDG